MDAKKIQYVYYTLHWPFFPNLAHCMAPFIQYYTGRASEVDRNKIYELNGILVYLLPPFIHFWRYGMH